MPFGNIGEVTETSGSEEEVIATLKGVGIFVANHTSLTERVLAASPNLRLVIVAHGGPTNANVKIATVHGGLVCNAPIATAEHTLSLILSVLRRISETDAALHRGEWLGKYYEYENSGQDLEGSTAGLIGNHYPFSLPARACSDGIITTNFSEQAASHLVFTDW